MEPFYHFSLQALWAFYLGSTRFHAVFSRQPRSVCCALPREQALNVTLLKIIWEWDNTEIVPTVTYAATACYGVECFVNKRTIHHEWITKVSLV